MQSYSLRLEKPFPLSWCCFEHLNKDEMLLLIFAGDDLNVDTTSEKNPEGKDKWEKVWIEDKFYEATSSFFEVAL